MSNAVTTWQGESASVEQTLAIARTVAQFASAGDVLALAGELGAGKTQFVRGLAQGLGVADAAVASPTFVMVHEYEPNAQGLILVHIDAYRLRSLEDLESIGWSFTGASQAGDEMRAGAVVAIEWADRLGELTGNDVLHVQLSHLSEQRRLIRITATGRWLDRMPAMTAIFDELVTDREPMRVPCPTCKANVDETAETFPFCSKRCKLIDLGKWLKGDYLISRPLEERDLEEGE